MKFYNYLNEKDYSDEHLEEIKETLQKRCMPFLKEFDASIYRGYQKGLGNRMIARKAARKDRIPRFIPIEVHKELDDLLESMYGWRPRSNGVFTADKTSAGHFGMGIQNTFMFFPAGKYQYIWTAQISELYKYYDDLTKENPATPEYEDIKDNLINFIKSGIYNTNRLKKIVKNDIPYEAIFNCESYYLVDTDIKNEITEFMEQF